MDKKRRLNDFHNETKQQAQDVRKLSSLPDLDTKWDNKDISTNHLMIFEKSNRIA